jgi:hypothetical protein
MTSVLLLLLSHGSPFSLLSEGKGYFYIQKWKSLNTFKSKESENCHNYLLSLQSISSNYNWYKNKYTRNSKIHRIKKNKHRPLLFFCIKIYKSIFSLHEPRVGLDPFFFWINAFEKNRYIIMAHQLNHVIKSSNGAKSNILFIFFSLYTSFLALFESISILSKLIYLKTTFRENSILQILD